MAKIKSSDFREQTDSGVVWHSDHRRNRIWILWSIQILFVLLSLIEQKRPFVSSGFERHNQTFDLARHVFHEGWKAVITPKASFSNLPNAKQPFTIVHLEVPFHGLFGWPFAALGLNEQLVVCWVSITFAVISIGLCYRVLRHWLEVEIALVGTTLWASAPLFIQFGNVPMPDIICTAAMIAAFKFSISGKRVSSSLAFTFAILAKESVIVFGLPILVALVIAENKTASLKQFIITSFTWGIIPLSSLLVWLSFSINDPPGSWTLKTVTIDPTNSAMQDLLTAKLWLRAAAYIFIFGLGPIGILALAQFKRNVTLLVNVWIRGAILVSIACCYIFQARLMWREPQYSLPVLFWFVFAASFGVPALWDKIRNNSKWKIVVMLALCAQCAMAIVLCRDLASCRVPNFRDLESAGRLLPPKARVLLCSPSYGATPAVLMNHNVLACGRLGETNSSGLTNPDHLQEVAASSPAYLMSEFQELKPDGFDYLLLFDYTLRGNPFSGERKWTAFTDTDSPLRVLCDARLQKIFIGDHVRLYSLEAN